jgi:hypothetical protein
MGNNVLKYLNFKSCDSSISVLILCFVPSWFLCLKWKVREDKHTTYYSLIITYYLVLSLSEYLSGVLGRMDSPYTLMMARYENTIT